MFGLINLKRVDRENRATQMDDVHANVDQIAMADYRCCEECFSLVCSLIFFFFLSPCLLEYKTIERLSFYDIYFKPSSTRNWQFEKFMFSHVSLVNPAKKGSFPFVEVEIASFILTLYRQTNRAFRV